MSSRPDVYGRIPADTRVIVGLSGGVDSAVCAMRLVEAGYRVSALFMQNWEDDAHCTTRQDYRDASTVASRLGIALDTVNFAEAYWDRVFEHFLAEYAAGRTPNPDVLCNSEIKFRAFLDHARGLGADCIATGHYARVERDTDGEAMLCRAQDTNKDQTYFLHRLDREQLAATLFPLADLEKSAVRAMAREAGLPVHAKRDSTGICFIGERRFRDFLAEYLPARPGPVVDEFGRELGRHHGLMFHTLGQRQGLGIGGRRDGDGAPWYVIDKDLAANALVVAQGGDHPRLYRDRLRVLDAHWVAGGPPIEASRSTFRATARIRHRHEDVPVRVTLLPSRQLDVHFDDAVRAATPGQSLVLYDGQRCLGGGIIDDFPASARDEQSPAATARRGKDGTVADTVSDRPG